MNTKERILKESMILFSINGYEAVSIRSIASAVGIGNSALYKHYSSKQAIFDAIVEKCKNHFIEKCKDVQNSISSNIEDFASICLAMFQFQIEDELIVMFRRILLIEQFKNEKMAQIFKEFFIDFPISYQVKIFEELINKGLMINKNAEILAIELYSPFFMYHSINCDKERILKLFKLHAEYFFKENFKGEQDYE